MKEKVMLLAQGKFTYKEPEIVLSTDKLKFEVMEGGEASSSFTVQNSVQTKIKGFGAVEDFCFDVLSVFDGKTNEISVKVNAANKKAGEKLTGNIHIITNCGERELPYEIDVIARCCRCAEGELPTYKDFVQYAKDYFDDAVGVFFQDKFSDIYLKDLKEKRLYHYLTSKNPKKQALEEFLVAHGDKKPVQFIVNKKQLAFEASQDNIAGEIIVAKDSWGMIGIKVAADADWFDIDKSFLYAKDFSGNQALIHYEINVAGMKLGVHHGKVTIGNVYQEIEVAVRVHVTTGCEERKKAREEKKLIARLVKSHIQYMMNSSRRQQWLQLLLDNRERILSVYHNAEMLFDGYTALLSHDEKGTTKYMNAVEGMSRPDTGETPEKVQRYIISQYIKCKINNNDEDRMELIHTIREYYTSGYRHWKLLVLLERLSYYRDNADGLMEELDVLWEDGLYSPYMHLLRMMMVLQRSELLTKVDSQTIGTLRFALKHDLITEDVAIAFSFLIARKRHVTPALMSLLEGCYEMFENADTLHSICALLIRSECVEKKYSKWFALGVKKRLRITELYECYMYSLTPEQYEEALPDVMSYFQYENHLRDSVKAGLYARIIANKEQYAQEYEAYYPTMCEFALSQLKEHRIGRDLAVLYRECIQLDSVKNQAAVDFPYILFAHHVTCMNPHMERVVVVHDEGGGEKVYNLVNGEATVHIGTENVNLYFVDKNGFYHANTVGCKIDKLINIDEIDETCYENGSEHPILMLNLFSKALHNDDVSSKDALLIHRMIREEMLGAEYCCKGLLCLYEYYKAIGEDELLEEVIGRMNFHVVPKERRAGVLQTMIQHRMDDEAFALLKKYEVTDGTPKILLLLISWMIEDNGGKFDPYYMRLCSFLYHKGVKNKTTLNYLVNYYMGSTSCLRDIYKVASKSGVEISDGGTERLLGQALFVSDDPALYTDLFLDYYEYGSNRVLVKAFLSYCAYQFVVGKTSPDDEIMKMIQKESLYEDNHVMILATLKHFSEMDTYEDKEREFIEYHLAEYAASGQLFTFMKDFVGKVEVPFEVEHAEFVTFYSSYRGEISIEIEKLSGEKFVQPMRKVFDDIYVYEMLLFHGEQLKYNIFSADREQPDTSGVLESKPTDGENKDMALYEIVNQMIDAKDKDNQEEFARLVKLYGNRKMVAKKLFKPL